MRRLGQVPTNLVGSISFEPSSLDVTRPLQRQMPSITGQPLLERPTNPLERSVTEPSSIDIERVRGTGKSQYTTDELKNFIRVRGIKVEGTKRRDYENAILTYLESQ
jgi:hypothetical protein